MNTRIRPARMSRDADVVSLRAPRDPDRHDDVTAGCTVGIEWLNTTTSREFRCASNPEGAATWKRL